MGLEAPLPGVYRRLLWAYPSWYRRERGEEILTTLLDAAPASGVRFNSRDALDLLIGGVRCRLGLPAGKAARLAAWTVALFVGVAASAVVGLAIWRASPVGPTRAQATSISDIVLPQREHEITVYNDPLDLNYGTGDLGTAVLPAGADPGTSRVVLSYRVAPEAVPALMSQARDRLERAGWRIAEQQGGAFSEYKDESVIAQGFSASVWAMKDDLIVQVAGIGGPIGDAPAIHVSVHRQASAWVTVGVAAAAGVGGLTGWLLTGWVARAYLRHGRWVRALMLLVALPGLLLAGLLTFMTVTACLWLAYVQGWGAQDSLAPAATMSGTPTLTTVAGACLAACALLATFAPRVRRTALPVCQYTD